MSLLSDTLSRYEKETIERHQLSNWITNIYISFHLFHLHFRNDVGSDRYLKALEKVCGFWNTMNEWVPWSLFLWNGWWQNVGLRDLELDKFTGESWLHHRLSKITSGPFFHLSEHNEDSNSYFTSLKTMAHFKTQNRDFSGGPVVKRLSNAGDPWSES